MTKFEFCTYNEPSAKHGGFAWLALVLCWALGWWLGWPRCGFAVGFVALCVIAGMAPPVFERLGTLTLARRSRGHRPNAFWEAD